MSSTLAIQPRPDALTRLLFFLALWAFKGLYALLGGAYYGWYRWYSDPASRPDLVKRYPTAAGLPARIFFPKGYDCNSSLKLPTYFSIHGGGFCCGIPNDDDECNRRFADMHGLLVVELNYRKAPRHPFPTAPLDAEELMLRIYDDESLPIDKRRIAVGGYSAGGTLALSLCQMPKIREMIKPSGVIPIYPAVDLGIPSSEKEKRRHYKLTLSKGVRSRNVDPLHDTAPWFTWGLIPYGQDLKDPLLNPAFAERDQLPPHIFMVASELDMLAHESWQFASRLADRPVPSLDDKVGQEKPSEKPAGELILDDERFFFEHATPEGRTIRWLLVPDAVHAFDHLPPSIQGDEETNRDAQAKTIAYQKMAGDWLRDVAWRDQKA